MIEYLLSMDSDNPKLIRHQFLISEILSYDISILVDYLFEPEPNIPNYQVQEEQRQQLLPLLFQPFQADYLNYTQVGYLTKIFESIIRKRGNSLWSWFDNNQCVLDQLIKHLDVYHVASILSHLITSESTSQDLKSNQHTTKRIQLLLRLHKILLNKVHNYEIVHNCSELLVQVCTTTQQFIQYFDHPEHFYKAACDSQFVEFLNIIIALLQCQPSDEEYHHSKYYSIALHLHRSFSNEYMNFAFNSTLGEISTTLGQFKLSLLTIYHLLLKTENSNLLNLIHHVEIYQTLFKYIIKFEFNNQLQIQFNEITRFIFKTRSLNWIQDQIQKDLFEFISTHNTQTKSIIGKIKYPINRGYFGILSQLSYELEHIIYESPNWNQYKENTLQQLKNIEQNYYFDFNPKSNEVEQISISIKENLQQVSQCKPDSIEVEFNNKQHNSDLEQILQAKIRISFPIKTLLSFSDMSSKGVALQTAYYNGSNAEPSDLELDSFNVTELKKKKICNSQNEYLKESINSNPKQLNEDQNATDEIGMNSIHQKKI
ncbi:unnamed protein product (macronuclear) [Paramecium tetraurelia]|uniref:FPL domain-containing protein n=1 Tax=Paramecium tetraurelia TaxID=5888 RepID=A0EIR0_PARTE|nr:uncharacterized protein GSPATT00027530001 [Paramecium tetraurelia]CAK95201.1 unnamed protein product [Paramecium tetraurelia]|eukprot:XP_001462574.1 hypothetical protein (macronuclear) [Paramecium tetraurelia strain d4-2]